MIKKIFLTAFTVQLATYVTTIIGMTVDGIVTGSFLGPDSLAAYGLVTPFLTVLTAIASAVSVGTSTLLSARLGKGDLIEMNRAFNICFWTTLSLSILVAAMVVIFSGPIATMLKADGNVHPLVVQYLKGYGIGFPPIFLVTLSIPVMQIIGKRKTLVAAIVSMTTVNILMDFFNVLVWHKQMLGMALATTVSYTAALVIVMIPLVSGSNLLSVRGICFDRSTAGEMAAYGAPNAVSMGCRNTLTIIMNHLIIMIAGMKMVASYAAVMSAMGLAMSIGIGMASTVSMLSGVFAGEKDRSDLIELIKLSGRYSVIINGICTIVFIVFARPILSLFLKDGGQMLADGVTALRIVVTSCILFSFNFCIRSYYQAMKMKITIPYAVFNCLISTAAIAFALGNTIGITGVWLAYPLGELLTLIVFGAYALRKDTDRSRSVLERFMMIPAGFYGDVEPLEASVATMEDVVRTSEMADGFMKEHGASAKMAMYTALAVEELAGNIIEHGFDDGKPHMVTLKLKKDEEGWLLRLRDNCRSFDPVTYVRTITPEQKASHYGITMIYGLADEIKYLNTLNLNNLLIRFDQR